MSSLDYEGEKYLVIAEGGDDYRCYFFNSLEEVQEWLNDGSFDKGDWLFDISNPRRLEYTTTREFREVLVEREQSK